MRLGDEPFDVINNVGSSLFAGGYGGDRGFLERDLGQYRGTGRRVRVVWRRGAVEAAPISTMSGCSTSACSCTTKTPTCRGAAGCAGWRYVYEPSSVVRHRHAQSAGVGSATFRFFTERNRLLVLAKNAPGQAGLRAGLGEVRRFARGTLSAYVIRPLRLQMPERHESAHRRRVVPAICGCCRAMLRDRRAAKPKVARRSLMSWEVSK